MVVMARQSAIRGLMTAVMRRDLEMSRLMTGPKHLALRARNHPRWQMVAPVAKPQNDQAHRRHPDKPRTDIGGEKPQPVS